MAVIGLGGRGSSHVNAWSRMPNVEIAAHLRRRRVAHRREVQAARRSQGLKKPTTYVDIRKLLDDKNIDAVSIATPNHWHTLHDRSGPARPARTSTSRSRARTTSSSRSRSSPRPASTTASSSRAARAGRHRRCGKPCRSCAKASSARSTWLAASATSGATPSARRRSSPCPPGVDYDLWTGPAPLKPFTKNRFHYNWHWFWDTGNGDLGNQGIHEVDSRRWGLGVTHPTKVSAIGGKFMFDDDQETPNTISASYEFDVDGKKKMMTFEVRHWISPHEAGIHGGQAGQHHRQPVLRLEGLPGHRQLQQVLLVPGQGPDSRDRRRPTPDDALGRTSSTRSAAASARISTPRSRKARCRAT